MSRSKVTRDLHSPKYWQRVVKRKDRKPRRTREQDLKRELVYHLGDAEHGAVGFFIEPGEKT